MKSLVKINNSELSFRLNLNYNNVYSRLRMLLGNRASLFADISTKSIGTTWYSEDDAEYNRLSEAPKDEKPVLIQLLNQQIAHARKDLSGSQELEQYIDDILEIPDESFIFYRNITDGYKFIIAGWGCKFAHQSSTDPNGGYIKRLSKTFVMPDPSLKKDDPDIPTGQEHEDKGQTGKIDNPTEDNQKQNVDKTKETFAQEASKDKDAILEETEVEKRKQHVVLRVIDQNNVPVVGEVVNVHTSGGDSSKISIEDGTVEIGELAYNDTFSIMFPNIQGNHERTYEVEPNVDTYDAFVKKYIKFSPVLFVEDQDGNAVQNYNIKIVINGQDSIYNSGNDGIIELPFMQEGQKFIAIDTANYANTEEYNVTREEAKMPYHFQTKYIPKNDVGITILDKTGTPMPHIVVGLSIGDIPCEQVTGEDGRAEFPYEVFVVGNIPVNLKVKGKGLIKSNLNYNPDVTEYTIQLRDKKSGHRFNWKWLALLPLLLLLGWGGYMLYNLQWGTPTWEQLQKGVVLIKSDQYFYVTTGLDEKTGMSTLYFCYNENERKIINPTFDSSSAKFLTAYGTGFFISEDGMIATNRHVADPIPPEDSIIALLKNYFVSMQNEYDKKAQYYQTLLNKYSSYRLLGNQMSSQLDQIQDSLDSCKNGSSYYDRIVKLCTFKVHSVCNCYAAFDNSILRTDEDQAFHPCKTLISGDPGTVSANDVAIIQLHEKEKIMPKDAYIFKIPDADPLEGNKEANADYEIWVLGYSYGLGLANVEQGIHPSHTKGNISSTNEQYLVQYTSANEGGSSGGPVLNQKRQLVAINNSGISGTQFRYGVRTKFLKELYNKVRDNSNVSNKK